MQLARRWFLLIALIVLLAAGLAACSGQTPGDGSMGTPSGDDRSGVDADPAGDAGIHCTETDPHPMGQSIARTYDVTYEEVMRLFCSGFAFDNILLAFQTSQQMEEYSPRELLHMRQTMTWDEIWVEIGLVEND